MQAHTQREISFEWLVTPSGANLTMLTCLLEALAFIARDKAQTRVRRSGQNTAYAAIAARGTETAPLQLLVQTQIR
jgi:hypothetical protein